MSRKRCRRVMRPLANPVLVAVDHATKLSKTELESMRRPVRNALDALRTGRLSCDDWCKLAGCLWMARSIEKQGIVRGLAEYLNNTDAALAALEARATAHVPEGGDASALWRAPTPYGHEITAIDTFVDLHFFQLEQLSYGEFARARRLTSAQIKTRKHHLVEALT